MCRLNRRFGSACVAETTTKLRRVDRGLWRPALARATGLRYEVQYLLDARGLRDVIDEAGGAGFCLVLGEAITGDGDEARAHACGARLTREVVTIELGQADID